MRTRKMDWIDTSTGNTKYSFQVKPLGSNDWLYICDGLTPATYETERERDAARRLFKRKQKALFL